MTTKDIEYRVLDVQYTPKFHRMGKDGGRKYYCCGELS